MWNVSVNRYHYARRGKITAEDKLRALKLGQEYRTTILTLMRQDRERDWP